MYTNNIAEFGMPIPATRRAAAAIGIHWMTITDHSCDLDETGDGDWSYATLQWEYTLQTPAGVQTFTRDNVALGGSSGASRSTLRRSTPTHRARRSTASS
jgi:hypothetical protein